MGTFHHLSAGAAGDEARHTPPVQKQHTLLSRRERPFHLLPETAAQDAPVPLPELVPHIHDLGFCHGPVRRTLRELQVGIFPGPRLIKTVHRGRRRAQDNGSAADFGQPDRRFGRLFIGLALRLRYSFKTSWHISFTLSSVIGFCFAFLIRASIIL